MNKSVYLTLLVAGCLWFAMRSALPVGCDTDKSFDDALALYQSGTGDTIEALNRVIDRQETDPQSAERLAEAYRMRGSFRLYRHELPEALADFEAALQLNPDELGARYGRAECYRQLGDPVRADAELEQPVTLELSDAFPGLKRFVSSGASVFAMLSTPTGAWLFVAAVWAFLTATNFVVGWGPTAEVAGSLRRLTWVAAVLGFLEVLPLGVWAALVACQSAAQVNGWLAAALTLLSLVATVRMLQPPVRLRGTTEKLPRVSDAAFLERITELANKMQVPVPLVRLWPSVTGSQQAQALVGCLPAPQLVVTDGILQRLSPVERDAVVAHELGHVSNGSLWLLTAVVPVKCAIATGISAWFPLSVVIPFGVALGMGLRRIVSRPLELDADRRAARAIGFRETTAALSKIHAINLLGNSGIVPLLVYATATHPSRDVRLWSLQEAAPAGDLPDLNLCAKTIYRHRIAALAACAVWTLTLAGTLAAALLAPQLPFLAAPLWILVLTPSALVTLAQRRQISLERRRIGHSRIRTALFVVALLACPVLAYCPDVLQSVFAPVGWLEESQYFLLYPLLLAGLSIPAAFWMRRLQETRKVQGEVAVAFQVQDFRRVLEIARAAPAVVSRDPLLRYNLAFARAICGDREGAIAEFEKLWRDKPAFAISAITLSVLLLDDDQVERALDVASQVSLRLPNDSATHILVARSLRQLGRMNDAQTACERALALDPGEGKAHAVAAAIALDDGEFFQSQQSIATALELAPGDPYVLLVRAEVVLKTQPFDNPRLAVEEALSAVRSNAFAFYRADVARLEQAFAEWERTSLVLETAAAATPAAV